MNIRLVIVAISIGTLTLFQFTSLGGEPKPPTEIVFDDWAAHHHVINDRCFEPKKNGSHWKAALQKQSFETGTKVVVPIICLAIFSLIPLIWKGRWRTAISICTVVGLVYFLVFDRVADQWTNGQPLLMVGKILKVDSNGSWSIARFHGFTGSTLVLFRAQIPADDVIIVIYGTATRSERGAKIVFVEWHLSSWPGSEFPGQLLEDH